MAGETAAGRVFARARGTQLWDAEGRAYLDLASGGVALLGHHPPRLHARIREALTDEPAPFGRGDDTGTAELELAGRLVQLAGGTLARAALATSRGEAVDHAIKVARAATRRSTILYTRGATHGESLGALSVSGQGRVRDAIEPLLGACFEVPFGDAAALEAELRAHKVAAVILEPVQVDAGFMEPPADYLARVRELTTAHGALLIADESRTGLGRMGVPFVSSAEGAPPDLLVVGAGLGGGLLPLAATLVAADAHARATSVVPSLAASLPGTALACRVGCSVLETIAADKLAAAAHARGEIWRRGLQARLGEHPLVREVRGRGMVTAIELGTSERGLVGRLLQGMSQGVKVFGPWLEGRLLERGVLCALAPEHGNVVLLEPALVLSEQGVEDAVLTIAQVLEDYRDVKRVLLDMGQRIGGQLRDRLT